MTTPNCKRRNTIAGAQWLLRAVAFALGVHLFPESLTGSDQLLQKLIRLSEFHDSSADRRSVIDSANHLGFNNTRNQLSVKAARRSSLSQATQI